VRNSGAAFSLASGATWVFTILAVAVIAAIFWQLRRLGSWAWALFFALLLGGVLGNLTDRLLRPPGFPAGQVVDFILTPWMWFGFNLAIYNVADMAIVSSMVLFLIITLMGVPLNGGPRRRQGGADSSENVQGTADEQEETESATNHQEEEFAESSPVEVKSD
jgi:signal peptidase II